MKEDLLQFIWKFQLFDKNGLTTISGLPVIVLYPGEQNKHSGPDFLNTRLKMGRYEWHGHLEVHVKSSDWDLHGHHHDPAYNGVALHVVWEHDKKVFREDKSGVYSMPLKGRVDMSMISHYEQLMNNQGFVPCQNHLQSQDPLTIFGMTEMTAVERLQRKSEEILTLLEETGNDWETTAYILFGRMMGLKENQFPFERLCQTLPLKTLQRHAGNPLQIEALLFGVAGFLEESIPDDPYYVSLQTEFKFLKAKYNLADRVLPMHIWKFFRVRPTGFPTMRIAQFASFINKHGHIFSTFSHASSPKAIQDLLSCPPNTYWETHFKFGSPVAAKSSLLGEDMCNVLFINVVAPLLFAYGKSIGNEEIVGKSLALLEETKAEKNSIIDEWATVLGRKPKSALDTQGLLELYNQYCKNKKCLSCKIGTKILHNRSSLPTNELEEKANL